MGCFWGFRLADAGGRGDRCPIDPGANANQALPPSIGPPRHPVLARLPCVGVVHVGLVNHQSINRNSAYLRVALTRGRKEGTMGGSAVGDEHFMDSSFALNILRIDGPGPAA